MMMICIKYRHEKSPCYFYFVLHFAPIYLDETSDSKVIHLSMIELIGLGKYEFMAYH